jgi:glucose/arabinose dehydrogenase/PKD repeat protein
MSWGRGLATTAALAIGCAWPAAGNAAAATLPAGFEETDIVAGLTQPMSVAFAPDGRTFVVEKEGVLKVAAPGSSVATAIYDISAQVNSSGDRGLVGLALDADFASNRFVYLLYTYDPYVTQDSTAEAVSRLTRIKVNAAGQVSDPVTLLGSVTTAPCPAPANDLDCIPSDGSTHSVGTVHAAPDGTLWVGHGDGADFGGVDQRAFRTYDERTAAGKILHIDRNGNGLPGHAFCPADDDLTHVCTKVWAAGFRNPFRFTLLPEGGLAIGDVGWFQREELSLARQAGRSFGWPCYEGRIRTPNYEVDPKCTARYAQEGTSAAQTPPDYDYGHTDVSNAAMAGPVYRGDLYPAGYFDSLFLADYGGRWVRRFQRDADGDLVGAPIGFASDWNGTELDVHPSGDLVYVDPGDFSPGTGSIKRIAYSPGNGRPTAAATADPESGDSPLEVQFSSTGSSDPDGDPLSYTWDFGDGSPPSTVRHPEHTFAADGTYVATLTVDDGRGKTDTDTVRIDVGNRPPDPQIVAPVDESTYRGGAIVQLQGTAADPGAAAAPELDWTVRLRHRDHLHPAASPSGPSASFVTATDHDADSHYEVTLTATDSSGLAVSETIQLRPETARVALGSSPPGVPLTYAGQTMTAPAAFDAAVGFETTLASPSVFTANGINYAFASWSDGGAAQRPLVIPPGSVQLTATYSAPANEEGEGTGGAGGGGAGGGGAGSGGPGPADTQAPQLRFHPQRGLLPRRGRLRGAAIDAGGVARVRAALALRTGKRCRWWSPRRREPARRVTSCSAVRWLPARLAGAGADMRHWTVRLGGRVEEGRYLVRIEARDLAGNAARAAPVRLRVR